MITEAADDERFDLVKTRNRACEGSTVDTIVIRVCTLVFGCMYRWTARDPQFKNLRRTLISMHVSFVLDKDSSLVFSFILFPIL